MTLIKVAYFMLNFLNLKSKPIHLFWGVASSLSMVCPCMIQFKKLVCFFLIQTQKRLQQVQSGKFERFSSWIFIFFILAFQLYIKTPNLFSGDYTLDINPVLLEDDAVFQCQVSAAADGVAPIRSRWFSVTRFDYNGA